MDRKFRDLIPLIIFTSFITVATGLICGFTLMQIIEPEMIFSFNNIHIITGISLTGFAASFLHLHKKFRAVRALFGLKTSWLSRELLFGSLFFTILILIYLNEYLKLNMHLNLLFPLASVFSLMTIFAVGKVYSLQAQLSWQGSLNLYSPFVSAVFLGTAYYQSQMDSSYLPVIIFLIIDFYLFTKRYNFLVKRKHRRIFHFQKLIIPSMTYLQIRGIINILLLPLLFILEFIPFYLVGVLIIIDRITFYSSAIQINPNCGISRVRNQILRRALS